MINGEQRIITLLYPGILFPLILGVIARPLPLAFGFPVWLGP